MRRFIRASLPVLLLTMGLSVAGAAEAGAPAAKSHSLFDLVILAGPIEYLLIVLSLICYSLALQWVFTIKRDTLIPDGLADELHNILAEGPTEEAVESARNAVAGDNSMLGNIIAAALDKRDFGYEVMKETAEHVGLAEHNKYISKVGWLSMFASSATLLGLLGTVSGIIGSFLKMSAHPGGVDPNILAANIGEALVCTATGLAIAIGALYFFFWLRNRVNQCSLDAAVITGEILDYFRTK
ncbi:MAG: MotA/TolQ/ExbB proton channel family protein [Planctomycetes bacterium]|nr:MotA/TolQ/ExbB proton channel family protein [Planctomycetota bacterium]